MDRVWIVFDSDGFSGYVYSTQAEAKYHARLIFQGGCVEAEVLDRVPDWVKDLDNDT